MQGSIEVYMSAVIEEWDKQMKTYGAFTSSGLNKFIETHEFQLLACGEKITKGLRVKENPRLPHETLDGVLGIVSLNIEIIRRKLKFLTSQG